MQKFITGAMTAALVVVFAIPSATAHARQYSWCEQLYYCSNPTYYVPSYSSYYRSSGWNQSRQIYNQPRLNTQPTVFGSPGWTPERQLYTPEEQRAADRNTNQVPTSSGWDPARQVYTQPSLDIRQQAGSPGWTPERQLYTYNEQENAEDRVYSDRNSRYERYEREDRRDRNRDRRSSRSDRSNRYEREERLSVYPKNPNLTYCEQILPGSKLDDGSCS